MNDTDILALRASPLPVYTTCQRCGEPKGADVLTLCHGCAERIWLTGAEQLYRTPRMKVCVDCGQRYRGTHACL